MSNNTLQNMKLTFESKYIVDEHSTDSYARQSGMLDLRSASEVASERSFAVLEDVTTDFTALSSRNQTLVTPAVMAYGNRRMTWNTYSFNLLVDKELDIEKSVANPESAFIKDILYPKLWALIDRGAFSAASGPVNTGAPNAAATSVTAAADGVVSFDATTGITSAVIYDVVQSYINGKYPLMKIENDVVAFFTGSENSALALLPQVVYNGATASEQGQKAIMKKLLDAFNVMVLWGSDGDKTYDSPLLPEANSERSCIVAMKDSVAATIGDVEMTWIRDSEVYQNSSLLKVNVPLGFMRKRGKDIKIIKTTIES